MWYFHYLFVYVYESVYADASNWCIIYHKTKTIAFKATHLGSGSSLVDFTIMIYNLSCSFILAANLLLFLRQETML